MNVQAANAMWYINTNTNARANLINVDDLFSYGLQNPMEPH